MDRAGGARDRAARNDPKVIFVLGRGRSGSTLLDRALGALEGFFSLGQIWRRGRWKPLDAYGCGCGVKLADCPVWSQSLRSALAGLSRDGGDVSSADLLAWEREVMRWHRVPRLLRARPPSIAAWPALDSLTRAASSIYRSVARVADARVLVDSTKWPANPGALGLVSGIEPYIIHLVRDPRAVAFSWQREKYDPDYGEFPTFGPFSSSASWLVGNGLAEMVVRRHVDRALRLRYEDFVEAPAETVARIVESVDEPIPELPFDGDRTLRVGADHTVAGNPSRFSTGTITIRRDDEWRRAFARPASAVVTALTWPFLRRYGYPIRYGRPAPS